MEISPVLKSVLAGSLSGTCSTVLFQPLDLLKTRLQAPVVIKNSSGCIAPQQMSTAAATAVTINGGRSMVEANMLSVLANVIRTEKVTGLWKGMAPSMMRCVPGVGIYFGSIHWLTNTWARGNLDAAKSVLIGATARSVSATLLIPFTVVKTRFESRYYGYTSVSEALRQIYKSEGGRGLTRGLLATILRDAPFSGCYLMFYTSAKKSVPIDVMYSKYQALAHFSCGILAGVLASTVTQPADVIKTKLQLFPGKFTNIPQVIVYVYQTYGVRGYVKGLVPRCLRRSLMAAMAWTVYEQLTKQIGLG